MLPAAMKAELVKFLFLPGLVVACTGCLVYTNRIGYVAHTNSVAVNPGTDSTTVFILAHLARQPTSGVLPFVFLLKEKGLYGFSVQLFSSSERIYRGGVIQAFALTTPTGMVFQSRDSTFVHHVPRPPYPGSARSHDKQFYCYFESPPVIAIADAKEQVTLTLDYTLITSEGKRKLYRLKQQLTVEREKGFSLPSI